MRSLLLASAATMFIAGTAFAQTATPGPAPTGAPNAATVTSPGASPGNAGTNTPASSSPSAASNSGGSANNASGAPNGPTTTAPGVSPGKTSSAGSATSAGGDAMAVPAKPMPQPMMQTSVRHRHQHLGSMGMAMSANGSASDYLHMAKGAVLHHNKALADDALSHAETRMLDRAVPQGEIAADSSPGVNAIENARKAVMAGDTKTALDQINVAMQQSSGMGYSNMSPAPMAAPTGSSAMSGSSSSSPLKPSQGVNNPSVTGMQGSATSTSDSGSVSGGTTTPEQNPAKATSAPSAAGQ